MQTNFRPEQLIDPQMRESESILRTCVHCGFCTATCPTYLLLGDELDSPRGRIYLVKDMLESGKPATPEVVTHIDRCLSCLSCMTTCPSGVNYMHLVDHARAHIEETYQRPWHDRLLRSVLAQVLPYPGRFRLALAAARLGKPFAGILGRLPQVGTRLAAMLALAPSQLPPRPADTGARTIPAVGPRRGRVALLTGCAQPVLNPDINAATIRLLTRNGIEVVLAAGEGCCGALVHHMGRDEASHAFAKRNIDAWTREIDGQGLDAIVITASGCGTTIKDYGFMFREDAAYKDKAARVAGLAKDITEYLSTLDLGRASAGEGYVVAYHSACSMQHGQQIKDAPKTLLKRAGFTVKDVPEGHICCGSAGTYNLLQPELSGQLRSRKTANIARTGATIVATGNIGCLEQLRKGFAERNSDMIFLHTVELLDWADGGPIPAALAHRAVA
ncbi:glycolate oxidase subunit GlcF [Chelatococcus asaccharovorans]|uniref:glycolate oxidase subunit GlcF n=1 Tax=Chelatococcus asaccharovorans TaxID=28210 RepID=UPI00224C775F|nr:glycolate oxidase subunit GlcF [Chelatococcus asaccharovorans]CAH1668826.1 glycolate dehydrogenase, putative iron-sulfur subunit [Chelatococcus asaccharovorans]CAH1679724.1 glycolate dehydrogenase, putative iron-sulfur subunit [Chelatococcus asaccharovorans]